MGTQAMPSSVGGGGGSSGDGDGISRQSSVCGLTLNAAQSNLGDPLRSMNLDELLRSVLPQSEFAAAGGGVRGLDGPASRRTADEVWHGIRQASQQPSVGAMTVEDFLSRAGVVAVDDSDRSGDAGGPSNSVPWHHQQLPAAGSVNAVFQDGQESVMAPLVGGLREGSTPGRKRAAPSDGVSAERTVERRQKRMIKNRESAARSRARRQAYTNELENKILRLEEENERLRKHRVLEAAVVQIVAQPDPHNCLRRNNSALF